MGAQTENIQLSTQGKNTNEIRKVDYHRVFAEIWKRRKLYYIVLPITFVISAVYIFSIPRTYETSTEMIPEVESKSMSGNSSLSALASNFGFDLSGLETQDAIQPLLYPDLLNDNGFISQMFSFKIKTADGKISTDYFTYLTKYQQAPWWSAIMSSVKGLFKKNEPKKLAHVFDPYHPTKEEQDVMGLIRSQLKIDIDKKNGSIFIRTAAQDPLVAKIVADSTMGLMKDFITKYRTNKARADVEYYKKLRDQAKNKYERQRRVYGAYADANTDIVLQSYKSKEEDLENEMQLLYNNYSLLSAQYSTAVAKLQQKTPVFILIQGASVPIKASKPKRMIFVLFMLILAFSGTSIYVLRDIIR